MAISPVSAGGLEPAQWIAVRYRDSTIRRSSSWARSSRLPDSSTAPPVLQNHAQCAAAASTTSAKPGTRVAAPRWKAKVSSAAGPGKVMRNSCGPVRITSPPPAIRTDTRYAVASSVRSTVNPPSSIRSCDVCASGRAQSAAFPQACDPYGNATRTPVLARAGDRSRTAIASGPIRPRSRRCGLARSHDSAADAAGCCRPNSTSALTRSRIFGVSVEPAGPITRGGPAFGVSASMKAACVFSASPSTPWMAARTSELAGMPRSARMIFPASGLLTRKSTSLAASCGCSLLALML
ncbi:hypothetical protein [Nonomuraea sp. GTA35]|uniref:hypothetical protein n=1 Tax=Nonomuraea sp. GTA35 TaxID=1676746 RepID=UPI0035BF0F1E